MHPEVIDRLRAGLLELRKINSGQEKALNAYNDRFIEFQEYILQLEGERAALLARLEGT